jgi:hypothetical protein
MFLLSLYSENRQINGSFSLKEHYNRPMYIVKNYTDELIRGLTTQNAQKVDMLFTPTVGLRFYVIKKCTPKRSFWNSVVVHAVCFKKVLHQCTYTFFTPTHARASVAGVSVDRYHFSSVDRNQLLKLKKIISRLIYTKNVCFEHRYLITPLTHYLDATLSTLLYSVHFFSKRTNLCCNVL